MRYDFLKVSDQNIRTTHFHHFFTIQMKVSTEYLNNDTLSGRN